jgi:hypothetical protein
VGIAAGRNACTSLRKVLELPTLFLVWLVTAGKMFRVGRHAQQADDLTFTAVGQVQSRGGCSCRHLNPLLCPSDQAHN